MENIADKMDRRAFSLYAEEWAAFQSALDAPTRPLTKLQALVDEPGFFDVDKHATELD
jgi:uncharacterized protein (DUF1778 family)